MSYNRNRSTFRNSRSSDALGGLIGCGAPILYLIVMGIIGILLSDDIVSRLFGAEGIERWHEVWLIVRLFISFLLGSLLIVIWLIVFLITIFAGAPLFPL